MERLVWRMGLERAAMDRNLTAWDRLAIVPTVKAAAVLLLSQVIVYSMVLTLAMPLLAVCWPQYAAEPATAVLLAAAVAAWLFFAPFILVAAAAMTLLILLLLIGACGRCWRSAGYASLSGPSAGATHP
jgi:hypothetical protein